MNHSQHPVVAVKNGILNFVFMRLPVLVFMIFSCESPSITPESDHHAVFLSFSSTGQTLPTSIDSFHKQVKIEIDHDVDLTRLVPEFDVPEGYTVFIDDIPQASGISTVDLSGLVTYELKNLDNVSTEWLVAAVPLRCKILIDASHDGGVWWFPQSEATGFNPNAWHQGQSFANLLREKGFEVHELGRGRELTEEMFFGYYIVIRAGGFETYTANELQVYTKLLKRGMNLAFFTDHKSNDPKDELGDHLGVKFEGVAFGVIDTFAPHEITANLPSLDYIAGSVLTGAGQNPDIQILGRLRQDDYADLNFNNVRDGNEPLAPPVMGILDYPGSRIFFIGDMNGLEIQSQPFIDNLIGWMGTCFQD